MNMLFVEANEILFTERPEAVPYNYRISYKVAQLCLILARSCGRGGCSVLKLHMISLALMSRSEMQKLIDYVNDRIHENTPIRFDPAVNRALNYGLADGMFLQQVNGLYRITDKGKNFVSEIDKEYDLMAREKLQLNELSNKLTEGKIKDLMSSWRYSDVANK
ncbi:hypothetical protein ABDB91_08895 [Desulfoscipio sp. XC116]|uniref:hypothetical protein n=1 Tax=Desulfoscipio sp. XC116 TaxID=3144975 RepID=UPI00325BFEB4